MGKVLCWGYNNVGQTKVPEGIMDIVDMVGGREHSIALRTNSSVVAWGGEMFTNVPEDALSNVKAIAAGWYHSLALKYDGTVVGWGFRAGVPQNIPRLKKIACGELFSVGVTMEDELVIWGSRAPILPDDIKKNVVDVAAAKTDIIVLRDDGSIMACNRDGELYTDIPFNAHSNVKSVSVGGDRFFVLKNDGKVISWPTKSKKNIYKELSGEYVLDVVDVKAGDDFAVFVKNDGRILILGENWANQYSVPEISVGEVVKKVAVGNHHGLLLVEDR
jgi:alpha-tubulin suppressor-like RCC1 family protein